MTKEKIHQTSLVLANLMVILGDVLDSVIYNAEEFAERDGYTIRHETKRYLKAAAHDCRMAGQAMREVSVSTQLGIGEDSDILLALIWLIIDRTGGNRDEMNKMYNDIKANRESALSLPLTFLERNAEIAPTE